MHIPLVQMGKQAQSRQFTMELKGFTTWGALLKNETWLS